MKLHPFPEPESPALEPYMLHARAEILAILRRLIQQRLLLTAYMGKDGDFFVTAVLHVEPDSDELILDVPANPAAQAQLQATHELVLVGFVDNIKVQFRATAVQATTHGGHAALRVRIPEALLRLQRRETFRVRAPARGRACCLVPQAAGGEKYESLRLLNISVGGLAVLSYPRGFELPVGEIVRNSILDLPGVGLVNVSFRVVNIYEDATGTEGRRVGCEFVELAPQARTLVQRYVNRIQAEERKLATAQAPAPRRDAA